MARSPPDVDVEADVCCICLQGLDANKQQLPCGHVMHKLCVTELQRCGVSDRCPLCRQTHADLTPLQVLVDNAAVHYSRKEFHDAADLWTKVLDKDPRHLTAAYNLGYCYHQGQGVAQDCDRAAGLYEEARRGGRANAASNLGLLYREKGNIQKAMDMYEEALRGGDAEGAVNLGNLHKEMGNISKATGLYEEARNRGMAVASFNLAHIYREAGDIPKAVELYNEASRGGNAKASFNLGLLYQQKGDIPQAMAAYEDARRGGILRAALNLGILHKEQGNITQAIALLEEALGGERAKAAFHLGSIHLRMEDLQKAKAFFAQAYESGDAEMGRLIITSGVLQRGSRGAGESQQKPEASPNSARDRRVLHKAASAGLASNCGAASSGGASSSSGLE